MKIFCSLILFLFITQSGFSLISKDFKLHNYQPLDNISGTWKGRIVFPPSLSKILNVKFSFLFDDTSNKLLFAYLDEMEGIKTFAIKKHEYVKKYDVEMQEPYYELKLNIYFELPDKEIKKKPLPLWISLVGRAYFNTSAKKSVLTGKAKLFDSDKENSTAVSEGPFYLPKETVLEKDVIS